MAETVRLIRCDALSSVAEYAYAATAPADARLIGVTSDAMLVKDRTP